MQRVRNVILGEAMASPAPPMSGYVLLCNADVNAALLRAATGARWSSSAAAPSHRIPSQASRPLQPLAHTSPHMGAHQPSHWRS